MLEMNSLTLNGTTYDCFVDDVARSSVVVCSASGENIVVSDSSTNPLAGLNIYGKSTQAGTPTPGAPVDIESIGDDGNVVVTVGGNTMSLMLANGLRGVPVTDKSIATYTDANGQMWCADEIDFERGVLLRRSAKLSVNDFTISVSKDPKWYDSNVSYSYELYQDKIPIHSRVMGYCSHFQSYNFNAFYNKTIATGCMNDYPYIVVNIDKSLGICSTVDEFKRWCVNNNVIFTKFLSIPTETQLTDEQLNAFKVLYTNKPSTVAHNDSGAYMSMKYIADAKAYIDNKVAGILSATVE